MLKSIERMSPGKRVAVVLICIFLTLCIIIFIGSDVEETKKAAFQQHMDNYLSVYGSAIEKCEVDINSVTIHVNSTRWNATPRERQKEVMAEICGYTQEAISKCEIDRATVYLFANGELAGMVTVEAK